VESGERLLRGHVPGDSPVRPGQLRAFLCGLVCGAAVTTATVIVAAPARADQAFQYEYGPAVCDIIAHHPTIAGLTVALEDVAALGYTAEESGQLVAESVFAACPRYVPLLRQFVAIYGPKKVA
jgi:hypothetical protein